MAFLTFGFLLFFSAAALCDKSHDDFKSREEAIFQRLTELYKNETFARLHAQAFAGPPRVKQAFNCTVIPPSDTVPQSVHRLRPGDIKVIGAMGDSLTAARGADNGVVGMLFDYKGLSWSVGGDSSFESFTSLPNILRNYNPGLYGMSTGLGIFSSHFNVAVSGDKVEHMLGQAQNLAKKMLNDHNVNYANDWKLITIFIGGNDLCASCKDLKYTVDRYKQDLQAALDYLHANVPRAMVNMVEILDIEMVYGLKEGFFCNVLHLFICQCVAYPLSSKSIEKARMLRIGYQDVASELANSGRYDTRDDFTVVAQPFYRNTELPRTADGGIDYSYFAADCFHYSKRGQEETAQALWNNMVEPVGSKRTKWTPGEPIECPSEEHPFLYTSKNSHSNHVVNK